ncbi:sigma-70 family RNA polymerase sigma factor [Bordetella hinzii]|uniref:Sigma-70, region 4 n=1 Tax=Bordetella hinzii OH87 BAL007II TaxID=1331262 RepID=A0ABR4R503_9BORD|nr:sigma-70 family RNA polymerase sigma factor [Bordetella hinzii]KCB24590.1 sigma-70, region 4 [Bordetella hinzii OH87 BAL007II]KCB39360.1 sigma-70, region 4 [Bordetella hinzii 5132]QDJ43410.1 RNA polymerase subunit sigma [Bordetella hinzii]QDJ47984.1 RNA polymerase subunit sigma [Bordetella hinzii]QDJ56870.1 RNA polymerase subunit sigma [Bordetella hinzii]
MPAASPPAPADKQFSLLYAEHHGWLCHWLQRRLGDHGAAADLAQDTFLNVLAGQAADIREPRPFLATIARRLLVHRHRREQLETAYMQALAALPAEHAPPPEAHLAALQALRALDRALNGLPAKARDAFLLAHIELLSYADIAARLRVSASSVKQYLRRANRQCFYALAG